MHSQIILCKRGVLYQYRLTAKTRKNKRTSFLNTFYLFVLIIYEWHSYLLPGGLFCCRIHPIRRIEVINKGLANKSRHFLYLKQKERLLLNFSRSINRMCLLPGKNVFITIDMEDASFELCLWMCVAVSFLSIVYNFTVDLVASS